MKNKRKIIVRVLLLLLVGSAVGWNIWSGTGHLTGSSADKQKMDEEQEAVSGEQEAENEDSDHSKQDEKTGKSKNSRKQSSATQSEQWEEADSDGKISGNCDLHAWENVRSRQFFPPGKKYI